MEIKVSTTRPFSAETMSGVDLSWAKYEILLKGYDNLDEIKAWCKTDLQGKNRISEFRSTKVHIAILYLELETDLVLLRLRW